jgi:hypothetical protein
MNKSRKMRLAEHVARIGLMRNSNRNIVAKPEINRKF